MMNDYIINLYLKGENFLPMLEKEMAYRGGILLKFRAWRTIIVVTNWEENNEDNFTNLCVPM